MKKGIVQEIPLQRLKNIFFSQEIYTVFSLYVSQQTIAKVKMIYHSTGKV